jgi:hypothetical protein
LAKHGRITNHTSGNGSLDGLQQNTAPPSAKRSFERRESTTVARGPAACHSPSASRAGSCLPRSLDSAASSGMEEVADEHGGSGHCRPCLDSPGKEAVRSPRWGGGGRGVEHHLLPEQIQREEVAGSSADGPRFPCTSTPSAAAPSSRVEGAVFTNRGRRLHESRACAPSGVEEAAGVEWSGGGVREPRGGERRSGWAADTPMNARARRPCHILQLALRRPLELLQWLQHLQNLVAARVADAVGDGLIPHKTSIV